MTDETSQITVDINYLKRIHPASDRANGTYSGKSHEVDGWNACINYLNSAGYFRAPLPRIEGLRAALNNVCETQKDVVVHCPERQKYHVTHNGEWFLWCGDKAHADALIKAARAYLEASEVGHVDDINVADMGSAK